MHDSCQAPGCNSRSTRKGASLCEKHYMRMRRNGTFDRVLKTVPDAECIADGCVDRAALTTGECRNCYLRRQRNGSYVRHVRELHPSFLDDENLTYSALHQRLNIRRGGAKHRECVDCGNTAQQWSYSHGCANERIGVAHDGVTPAPFCPHLDHYFPRCIPCHKRFDLNQYPLNGRPYVRKST